MKKNMLFLSALLGAAVMQAQTWDSLNATFNQVCHTMIVFDNKLFFGGNFTKVDNQNSLFSAHYDGTTVTKHNQAQFGGSGFDCFTVHKNKLYGGGTCTAGGAFGPAMAMEWDGAQWGNSSLRLNSNVYAMTGFGDDLIVGGNFTDYIKRHDGISYSNLGNGFDAPVASLASFKNNLYASGAFTKSGTTSINGIAKWDGTAWTDIGNTIDIASDMVVYNNALYMMRKNTSGTFLSKWDGTSWTDIPGIFVLGVNNYFTLVSHSTGIYIGGDFSKAGTLNVSNLVVYNGATYNALPAIDLSPRVSALALYGNDLYVAKFSTTDNTIKRLKFPPPNTGFAKNQTSIRTLQVYPNPAASTLTLDLPSHANASYTITDIAGNMIHNTALNGTSIDVSGLSTGIYFLSVYDGSQVFNTKFTMQ